MIRLLVFLFIGLFATWQIAGADHGQKRHGLMQAALPVRQTIPDAAPARVVFVPAQPVMQPIAAVTLAPPPDPAPSTDLAVAQPVPALPEPNIPGGKLFIVAGQGANVRRGPGTTFAVLDSLLAGDQVLVVEEPKPTPGWSKIRIEGDGVAGYVATRLLSR